MEKLAIRSYNIVVAVCNITAIMIAEIYDGHMDWKL